MDVRQGASVLIAQAQDAQGSDWPKAASLAATLRRRFPNRAAGYRIGAASARAMGQADAAVALLAEATERFPEQPWPLAERASIAITQGDTEEAARLASQLRRVFPDHPAGYQFRAASERKSKQFEAAAATLAEAAARFPAQAWPHADLAMVAMERGDFDRAIDLAAALRRDFPHHQTGYRVGASALSFRDRLGEAETVLRDALNRFQEHAYFERQLSANTKLQASRTETARFVTTLNLATPAIMANAKRALTQGPKVVVVLGMHRSGTSLCTRLVNDLGIPLGAPLIVPHYDNPDGYQELKPIVDCHEALLEMLGAAWDTLWLTRPAADRAPARELTAPFAEQLKHIVAEQLAATGGVWAFKDPRTMRFLPLWQGVFDDLGIRPIWLLAVRDPRAVAASLFVRNGFPLAVSELLWVEHHLEALRHLGPRIDGIIHYEKWFSSPREQLRKLVTMLEGTPNDVTESVVGSIKTNLRHNVAGQEACTLEMAGDIYSWLCDEHPDLNRLQRQAEAVWRGIIMPQGQ